MQGESTHLCTLMLYRVVTDCRGLCLQVAEPWDATLSVFDAYVSGPRARDMWCAVCGRNVWCGGKRKLRGGRASTSWRDHGFTVLLFLKSFHWLAEDRADFYYFVWCMPYHSPSEFPESVTQFHFQSLTTETQDGNFSGNMMGWYGLD
ncbi:uncharacterized protein LOC111866626 isoform X2 [Cryptotermes secundus]|uniref:uncharacterized protein LOC111866626 isoform X2 n=1 Tax=Cryptotermes secundus TaxID=105785 RepID=UPI000CD7AF5A|nr:uncharacterized protein LOC111866626 isoform X2 [Cryptotermes secundus]